MGISATPPYVMDQRELKHNIKKFHQGIIDVPYERQIVAVVDKIMELVKQRGYPATVSTDKDWEIVEFIWRAFTILYPLQYEDFKKRQEVMKSNQKNKHASSKEKGGAQVRHLLEIPMPFYKLINAAFPQQKVQDKKFALEMGRRLPLFRWADKQ